MSDIYSFVAGPAPLLLSIPHDGREVPADIAGRMTAAGRALPDTDWHVAQLYDFARTLGANIISARYSRYVVDLNRPPGDDALYPGQLSTGLCPVRTFAGDEIYNDGAEPGRPEQTARVEKYWRPYHERIESELQRIHDVHGYALLWDAHSIVSTVPALFDGELPVLNLGTFGGKSCAAPIQDALQAIAELAPYSAVCNGRFAGGYITRNYGRPQQGVHAVQLEIAQRAYMDENTLRYDVARAHALSETLRGLLRTYIESAHACHR